ncbi:MAG TPA: discoidin domain-containing protein, partial [Polyangiaceae bacterium]|nr:discoidin domain-containing protein [Polyangiaceae bacterium]
SGFCVPAAETGREIGPSGWSATASNNSMDGSEAFDGSTFYRWSTGVNQEPGMWFTLDFGSPQIFFKIVLRAYDTSYIEPDDGPALFDMYESNDGTFTAPVKQNMPGSPLTTIHFDSAQRARYVQFKLDAVKGKWWSINELHVYQ